MEAPYLSSSSTTLMRFFLQAICKGVNPFCKRQNINVILFKNTQTSTTCAMQDFYNKHGLLLAVMHFNWKIFDCISISSSLYSVARHKKFSTHSIHTSAPRSIFKAKNQNISLSCKESLKALKIYLL